MEILGRILFTTCHNNFGDEFSDIRGHKKENCRDEFTGNMKLVPELEQWRYKWYCFQQLKPVSRDRVSP